MKKCIYIVILIFSLHEGFELRTIFNPTLSQNKVLFSYNSHNDDIIGIMATPNFAEKISSQVISESYIFPPQENHSRIWKPPANS
jgi:hypothetical protein